MSTIIAVICKLTTVFGTQATELISFSRHVMHLSVGTEAVTYDIARTRLANAPTQLNGVDTTRVSTRSIQGIREDFATKFTIETPTHVHRTASAQHQKEHIFTFCHSQRWMHSLLYRLLRLTATYYSSNPRPNPNCKPDPKGYCCWLLYASGSKHQRSNWIFGWPGVDSGQLQVVSAFFVHFRVVWTRYRPLNVHRSWSRTCRFLSSHTRIPDRFDPSCTRLSRVRSIPRCSCVQIEDTTPIHSTHGYKVTRLSSVKSCQPHSSVLH